MSLSFKRLSIYNTDAPKHSLAIDKRTHLKLVSIEFHIKHINFRWAIMIRSFLQIFNNPWFKPLYQYWFPFQFIFPSTVHSWQFKCTWSLLLHLLLTFHCFFSSLRMYFLMFLPLFLFENLTIWVSSHHLVVLWHNFPKIRW